MRRQAPFALLVLLTAFLIGAAPAAADYEAVELASGLSSPLYVTEAPDGSGRLFIVEQSGRIKIYEDGGVLATPFLDLSGSVVFGGERGLLGLAFHPGYADNGTFYVNFNPPNELCDQPGACSVVARFSVSGGNPDLADPGSRADIMEIRQPYTNHNGGNLAFGPDGYLYIGWGDGGSGGDPLNNAQNDQVLLGKMLRIDVDGAFPYAIPADNPFVGEAPRDEIWALGLRNPWRYSFDRLTGDLWIADVGQYTWEEVNHVSASSAGGENYGWRLMEGNHCFNPPSDCDDGSLTHPVYEYIQSGGNCSVTGGYVYRGATIPELSGRYIFGDYCTGNVWALDPSNYSAEPILTDQNLGNITSFGEDAAGELYLTASGKLWKIQGDSTDAPLGPGSTGLMEIGPGFPNPFRQVTRFTLALKENQSELEVGVYSVAGRRLRDLHSGSAARGALDLEWDGRDAAGQPVPAGVYFLRAETRTEKVAASVTLLR